MPDDDLTETPDNDRSADEIAIRALIERQIDSWNAADPMPTPGHTPWTGTV